MKKNDKVKVCAEWLPGKIKGKAVATILEIEEHEHESFAVVDWKYPEYGNKFPLHELKEK